MVADYSIHKVEATSILIEKGRFIVKLKTVTNSGESIGPVFDSISNTMGIADDEEVQNLSQRLKDAVERVANGKMFGVHDPEGRQV